MDPRDINELLNVLTGKLANTIHVYDRWRAKKKAQGFKSAIAELLIGGARVTGSASAALQRAYKEDDM